jgi:hypothetical protein
MQSLGGCGYVVAGQRGNSRAWHFVFDFIIHIHHIQLIKLGLFGNFVRRKFRLRGERFTKPFDLFTIPYAFRSFPFFGLGSSAGAGVVYRAFLYTD